MSEHVSVVFVQLFVQCAHVFLRPDSQFILCSVSNVVAQFEHFFASVLGGCNGLSYVMDYATEAGKFEDVVEEHGVAVMIEPKAFMHIVGTKMDYVEDELSCEFVFHNPNSKGDCGCGESFNV